MPGLERTPGQLYLPCMKATRVVRVCVGVRPPKGSWPHRNRYFGAATGATSYASYPNLARLKSAVEVAYEEHCAFVFYCARTKKALAGEDPRWNTEQDEFPATSGHYGMD